MNQDSLARPRHRKLKTGLGAVSAALRVDKAQGAIFGRCRPLSFKRITPLLDTLPVACRTICARASGLSRGPLHVRTILTLAIMKHLICPDRPPSDPALLLQATSNKYFPALARNIGHSGASRFHAQSAGMLTADRARWKGISSSEDPTTALDSHTRGQPRKQPANGAVAFIRTSRRFARFRWRGEGRAGLRSFGFGSAVTRSAASWRERSRAGLPKARRAAASTPKTPGPHSAMLR